MPFEPTMTAKRAALVSARKPFTLTGRHVLVSMILFFAVVGSVNAVMMTIAIRTMPGLVARNGYDVSQLYNSEIEAAAAQAGRGWNIRAKISKTSLGALISADVSVANTSSVAGASVQATLEHPATRHLDRVLTLKETSAGRYEGVVEGLPPGAWTLVLRVDQSEAAATTGTRPAFISRNRVMVEG